MLFRWFLLLTVFLSACHSPAKPLATPFTTLLTQADTYWIYHSDMRPDSGIVYSWCTRYSPTGMYTTYYFDERGRRDWSPPIDGIDINKGAWWFRESDNSFGLGNGEQDRESKIFHVHHYNQDTVFLRNSEDDQSILVRWREGTGVNKSQAL